MRKLLTLGIVFSFLAAVELSAQTGQARMSGKVVDAENNPISGVTVRVESAGDKPFDQTITTNNRGDFAIMVQYGTIPYKFTFTRDGFQTYVEEIKMLLLPQKNERVFTLQKPSAAGSGVLQPAEQAKPDPSVVAYNTGVQALNAGDDATALARFEESVSLKADFALGHQVLAQLYAKRQEWQKAISSANRALELAGDDPAMFTVLAEAYSKTGNAAKAAEFKAKAPKSAVHVFNEAARLINGGRMEAAEPLLKQAIEIDAGFAPAHYELGMLYAAAGKNAEAKKHLQRFLELKPTGDEAATAKEMMNYLK
jgi:tetratricopeptide (TPR) repeat protein